MAAFGINVGISSKLPLLAHARSESSVVGEQIVRFVELLDIIVMLVEQVGWSEARHQQVLSDQRILRIRLLIVSPWTLL